MKRDPFYEEDFLSEQIGKEEMNRKMKLKNFAKEKREMYKEFVNNKEMEAQKKKEKYKSQFQCANNKVDKTQRKWYLNSDIFNMKPLPQKEETQNISNDNESNIKLTKEEYLQFKEYLNEQERNKQQILEQYTQCKQNKHNDNNNKHKSSNIINTNKQPQNEMSQIPDYEYLQQYSNSLKQQNDMETQNKNIQQLLNQTKQEYLNNKHKSISTYDNLTHSITIHPSLKTKPHPVNYINQDKLNEINSKLTKQKQYKQILDQQNLYNKHYKSSNYNTYNPSPSFIQNNPLIPF